MTETRSPILHYATPRRETGWLVAWLQTLAALGFIAASSVASFYLQPERYTATGHLVVDGNRNWVSELASNELAQLVAAKAKEMALPSSLTDALQKSRDAQPQWSENELVDRVKINPIFSVVTVKCTAASTRDAGSVVTAILRRAEELPDRARWSVFSVKVSAKPVRSPLYALPGLAIAVSVLALLFQMRTSQRDRAANQRDEQ